MTDEIRFLKDRLGDCVRVFKPSLGKVIASFFFIPITLAAGLAAIGFPLREAHLAGWDLPIQVEKGWCWLAVGLFCLLGAFSLMVGILLTLNVRFLLSHRVEVCVNGFRYCAGHSVDSVLWTEVCLISKTTRYERPPILKWPAKLLLPEMASTTFTVIAAGGKQYSFNGASVKSISEFEQVLFDQASQLSLAWESIEIHA